MTTLYRNAIALSSLALMLSTAGCAVEGETHQRRTSGVETTCIVIAEPATASVSLAVADAGPIGPGDPDAGPITDGGVIDASPIDAGPPDAGETVIEFCGCKDPLTGDPIECEPMDYPPVCPEDPQAVVVSNPVTASYAGTTPPVAYYTCGDGTCEDATNPPVYTVTTETFVAEFQSPTLLTIYPVPAGAEAVQSPNGQFLFPLLEDTEPFADLSRPVSFSYQGSSYTLYLDIQNDCMPVGDRCLCFRC